MMEEKNVRCCDTAALVALINMLKVNLTSTPEIYNTLLAVLCDFDPCKLEDRDRTVRYIRLLVRDKVLANCLLMSLPQASEELQNIPFFTGTLPDMKRALKQNFQGMKVSVLSPKATSEDKSVMPASVTNQNITVIITDQDEAKFCTVEDSSIPDVGKNEPDKSSPSLQINKEITSATIPPSQSKSGITLTKSTVTTVSQYTSAVMKSSMSLVSINCTTGGIIQPADSSQSKTLSSKVANISKNISQSRLDDLVALVKSRSSSKYNSVLDCSTTSAENSVTNVLPKPVNYGGSYMNYSVSDQREQHIPHNSKQNINLVSQTRLQTSLLPLLYQPYTYQIQGTTNYQSCLTGYAANSLLPWTPLTYFQGYTPNPHFLTAPLHFGHLSSTSSMDSTLDLSLPKKIGSQTQSRHVDSNDKIQGNSDGRVSQKRSASLSAIPNENGILEPREKMRKMSAESQILSSSRYLSPDFKQSSKSQLASNSTVTYLSSDDGKSMDQKQNSLKALQELTLRIDGNSRAKTAQSQNLISSRKSLSTGSLTDSWKQVLNTKQNFYKQDISKNLDILQSTAVLKHYAIPCSKKSLLPGYKSATMPLTQSPKQQNIHLCKLNTSLTSGENVQGPVTSYQNEHANTLRDKGLLQLHGEPKVSHCIYNSEKDGISKSKKSIETKQSLPLSETHQKWPVCMRSFPYSQHIQLPDGNISKVDFPTLITTNSTNSVKTATQNDKKEENHENVSRLKQDLCTDVSDTATLRKKSNETLSSSNGKDYVSKYSLFMKKNDITSKTEENIQPEMTKKGQESVREIDQSKSKETCLIIETTSENGTEQVEFKLDKKRSANLLGELLKFKPLYQNENLDADSKESDQTRSVSNEGQQNSYQNISQLNNQTQTDDNVYNPGKNYQALQGNNGSTTNSQTESSLSSLNMSPYLFGMLPDTTTLLDDEKTDCSDDTSHNNDEFTDCDDEDDDVFLHPIF